MARYDRVIPSGGEGRITLTVDIKGEEGNIFETAKVYTNDPGNKVVQISVTAFVRVSISLSPRIAYLVGFAGDTIEKVVTVQANNPVPLFLAPISFSLSDEIDYSIETLEKGRYFRIVFRNKSVTAKRYRGVLKLRTNYPDKPVITIKVIGNIKAKKQQSRDMGQ